MIVRVCLLDFLSIYNGQLTGKRYFNLHRSVKEEEFYCKYGLSPEALAKMKDAVREGNFRILPRSRQQHKEKMR